MKFLKITLKFQKPIYMLFTIFLFLIPFTIQDLPVHCLGNKIEGDWILHMGDNHSDKDVKCGHKRPDQNLDHYDVDINKALNIKHEILVRLERPNKILSMIDQTSEIGTWTMIYDEGFEMTIGDQVFFSFSKYIKEGKFSPSNTDTEETIGYRSMCDKTFIGWYNNQKTNENWGCFWGEKIQKKKLSQIDLKKIDYNNIFKFSKLPILENSDSEFNSSSINNLQNNFIKKNKPEKDDIFTLLNDASTNKPNLKTFKNSENNTNNLNKNKLLKESKFQPNKKLLNGPVKLSTENSYTEFVKSLGWGNTDSGNSSAQSNIPHLDIYFLNKMSDGSNSVIDSGPPGASNNFLEMEATTKIFKPDMQYVSKINDPKNGYMWQAKVYDDFVGKSYNQMRNLLGNVNFFKTVSQEIDNEEEDINKSQLLELEIKLQDKNEESLSESSRSKSKSHFDNLPETFDWRNIDGTNYEGPIRKQGECGSCYAIAAVSVLETRIRIKSNNRLKPILSPSSVISCSRYNQGCAGGYPYLVGKHGKEFGFVEENCQPYSETDDKCINFCYHQKKWKVKDYG